MAVHFVYRSHYDNPTCFYVKRFKADSVLAWFQSIWQPVRADDAGDHADQLLGTSVYSFGNLFEKIDDEEWPAPKTMKVLASWPVWSRCSNSRPRWWSSWLIRP